jgi:hypothetical protein
LDRLTARCGLAPRLRLLELSFEILEVFDSLTATVNILLALTSIKIVFRWRLILDVSEMFPLIFYVCPHRVLPVGQTRLSLSDLLLQIGNLLGHSVPLRLRCDKLVLKRASSSAHSQVFADCRRSSHIQILKGTEPNHLHLDVCYLAVLCL